MIEHFRVQNYRCLRDVSVDFGPLTILVGPNDSGKSTILDALWRLSTLTYGRRVPDVFAADGGDLSAVHWLQRTDAPIGFELRAGSIDYEIGFDHRGFIVRERLEGHPAGVVKSSIQGRDRTVTFAGTTTHTDLTTPLWRYAGMTGVTRSIESTLPYTLDVAMIRRGSGPTREHLSPTGANLAGVLDRLFTGPDAGVRRRIESELCDRVAAVSGIALSADIESGTKALQLALHGAPHPVPAEQISDGVLLLLAFLVIVEAEGPELVLVEEPENGLHPRWCGDVLHLLRSLVSTGKRQVVLTTHSPILLNFAEPEEVRIVTRHAALGTHVSHLDRAHIQTMRSKGIALGDLWYAIGEDGLSKAPKRTTRAGSVRRRG